MDARKHGDIIHVNICDPANKIFGKGTLSESSSLHIYTCKENMHCDAFKNGQCINVGNAFGARCPIGKKSVTAGFTRRAKNHYKQMQEWKEKYSMHYRALKPAPKKITKVPGGWMLPYSYMGMNEKVPFASTTGFFSNGEPFISDQDFNKTNFNLILSFKPQSMIGGTISQYASEVIPKFVKDFGDNYPDKFKEIACGNELVNKILGSYSYMGRKAYLKTVKHNTKVKVSRSEWWYWDGEKIFRKNEEIMTFDPIEWVKCYASFTPSDQATIEITDNEQVTEFTKFAD